MIGLLVQVSTIDVKTAKWLESNMKAELRGIGLKGEDEEDCMKKAPDLGT